MDEYSQANAEDMEVATEFAKGQVVGLATNLGMGAGALLLTRKNVKNWISKISKGTQSYSLLLNLMPPAIGSIVGMTASFPAILWATKAKISASRHGRFEAMNKDLQNPAVFTILTQEQEDKIAERSKNIELDTKDKNRLKQKSALNFNPINAFKRLKNQLVKDKEYEKQKAEFDKKLNESETKFGSPVTEEQIRAAKRDKQILADMVRRMDLASQDYAENTELATNTLTVLSLGTGGLVGWISSKLINLLKINNMKLTKYIPYGIGAALPLAMGIYSASLQKQASRIGRFNVKQEMLNNPSELVYVDEKELASITDVNVPHKQKKPNMFKFFIKLIKDNKKYKDYLKTKGTEELKRHKALGEIELSQEQIQKAKSLQNNLFKTFNKVDEKSQTYSESVEAMGECIKSGVGTFGSLAFIGITMYQVFKMLNNPAAMQNSFKKTCFKILAPFGVLVVPIIAIDILTTKAQKKASRVADMLALKDLEDYRHYVDYSETQAQQVNSENLLKQQVKS